MYCVGILLAAGRGRRFDPEGLQNKLLQLLTDGEAVALRSARRLSQALDQVLVVVAPDAQDLQTLLTKNNFALTVCDDAGAGMGHSLAHAIAQSKNARGWIIALADMPQVEASTIVALDTAIRDGANIAVPVYQGKRGNPVGFSNRHRDALLQSHGDRGARHLLIDTDVTEVAVDDAGIFLDVDVPLDLQKLL